MTDDQDNPKKPGPDEERLKIDTDWDDAAKRILSKKKPKEDGHDSEKDDPKPGDSE